MKSGEALGLPELARRQGVGTRRASRVAPASSAAPAFGGDTWVLEMDPGTDLDLAATQLERDPQVLYAGPNHLLPVTQIAPDDSLFPQQYALASARVPEAWETSDGAGILIAIIDTGVELDHPDLEHQIAINAAEANGLPGVDDDGNGYVDDVRGFDFTDVPGYPGEGDYLGRDADPSDDVGHGTEVAGVAAAERNNGRGIAGVAPGARVLPVRAGFRTAIPFIAALLQEDDAAAAILYAVDRGAKVLNLSFGDVVDAPLIRHAVRYARERGALVVASAGNTGQDHPFFPAAYPGVLVPGASGRDGTRASFSTFGQDLDLLAPGVGLYTTDLDGTYRTATGTSFSAPMTCGTAALVWSAHPDWTADEVAWDLRLAAARNGSGWQPGSGWGLLDAAAAVEATRRPPVIEIESHPPDGIERGVRGTIVAPDLLEWSLFVLPESSAVVASEAGQRTLIEGETRQVQNDSLAAFVPPAGQEGFWVFRLIARLRDRGIVEERSRAFLPAPSVHADSVVVEAQADSAGWGLAAWWSSSERQQGALRLSGPDGFERFAMEAALGRHHGVRLEPSLPAGERMLDVLARPGETLPFTLLSELPVTLPVIVKDWGAARNANFPSGTPMTTVLDRNENGFPEVFVETPPSGNVYGFVEEYEVTGPGVVTERGASDLLFRGIPVDAADSDHDGNLELVVFRLDAWDIWESSTPSGFPDHLVHQETGTRPVRFIDAGLLVVSGGSLRLVHKDGSVMSEASSGGPDLEADAAIGDFDGDGREEIAIPNQEGDIAIFELSGTELRFETLLQGPGPFEPVLVALANGLRTDLVTVERDPPFPNQEGDLDRAATRLRLWDWDGAGFQTISTLAFAGMISPGRIELLAKDDELWLRRDRWFDAVIALDDSLGWRGRVFASKLPRVDGFTLAPISGANLLWIGNSAGSVSEDVIFFRAPAYLVAGPLEVRRAESGTQGLDVMLGWEENCSATLVRSGDVRGTYPLTIVDRSARDSVAIGESVRYTLNDGGCGTRTRDVFGRPVEPLVARWEKSEIALDFATPLRSGPLPEVMLRIGNRLEPPRAVHLYREGTELLIVPGKEPPDSIVVIGAWQVDGLPLGGSVRAAAAVPPFPGETSPSVLADVRYDAARHVLGVTLGGDSLACAATYLLEPEHRSFPETARAGSFEIDLGGPLAPGGHTLELQGSCIDPPSSTRSFRVGRTMYPNPVRAGQDLVVEGLEPGSRIAVYDLNGEERVSWRTIGVVETRPLAELPPGLYLVRFEGPGGTLAGIEKLAVIR